ncbi:MAG: glycosyltransferase family 9 protein [Candidatus Zixiibacteriota bacterium]|nr:MAG: glycosyltransferase family 9 protein [candidate division Zixibacteria bacterium]
MTAFPGPRRFLLCRTDKLGDVLLALPAALLLRRRFPQAHLAFLVQPYTAPVARMLRGLDEVIVAGPDESSRALAGRLKEGQFDFAAALYPERRLAGALRTAGIPFRAGIAYRWYSPSFTYRHREHRKHNLKHELEYNLSLVWTALGEAGRWEDTLAPEAIFPLPLELPEVPPLPPSPTRRIAIHPGGGGSAHRWPAEYFTRLAGRLGETTGRTVAVTGGPGEEALCRTVADESGAENLGGRFDLPRLAAFYRECALVVTNSTGPLHLARAVGAPVLGLFPAVHAMSPRRWGPYGQPDGFLVAPEGEGLDRLPVEAVLDRARGLLERAP